MLVVPWPSCWLCNAALRAGIEIGVVRIVTLPPLLLLGVMGTDLTRVTPSLRETLERG